MKQMHLGAQLYTAREHMKTPEDFRDTMRKVAEIGYKYVQVSGKGASVTPDIVAEAAKENGLQVVLTHYPLKRIVEETEKVIEEHDLFGCDYIGLGMTDLSTPTHAENFVKRIAPALEKIKAAGKKFLYHNHEYEFLSKIGDGNALDYILEHTDPDVFKITFCSYWCYYAKEDPAEAIRKYGSRIAVTHVKDMLRYDSGEEDVKGRMTEMLTGIIDYDEIMKACDEQNILWHFVEQDYVYMDVFESLKISHDNMKKRYNMQ